MILSHRLYGNSGETLIILHGLFGQSDNWTSVARKLGEHMLVYVMDLRNHGNSGHSDAFNYEIMSKDLIETMDDLGIEICHLLGHSMGGKVSMQAGIDFPERFKSLIIADIGPRYYRPHHQEIIEGLLAVDPPSLNARAEAELRISPFIPDFGTRQFLLKNLSRNDDGSFTWKFNLPVLVKEIEEIGKELHGTPVQLPTLFYRGGKSNYIKDEDWSEIMALFPLAQLETMDDAGHWLHAEKPTELIEVVGNWVQTHA